MKLNIVKMMFALIATTSVFGNMMMTIKPEYVTTDKDEITITFEIPKEEKIEEIENTVEIKTAQEYVIDVEEIPAAEPEIIETAETVEPEIEEPIQNDTEEPVQEVPETVVEVKQDAPVVTRESNVYVNGISVYITDSVTDSDYNMVINWVAEMPSFLTNNIESVNFVDNITQYNSGGDAAGCTKQGKNIYVDTTDISDKKGTLYHEAGHCLDFTAGYSDTSKWGSICTAEWGGTGHYETTRESFAEAISYYYVDGLNKPQSLAAIESLINTGALGEDDGFKDNYVTLYAKYKQIWIYSGADDFYNPVISTVEIGDSVQAVGLNVEGTWYKVSINGQEGYCRADMVSLES